LPRFAWCTRRRRDVRARTTTGIAESLRGLGFAAVSSTHSVRFRRGATCDPTRDQHTFSNDPRRAPDPKEYASCLIRMQTNRKTRPTSRAIRPSRKRSLITSHGRATPLVWLSVGKDTLKDNRNRYEYQVLIWLAEALPADVKVLIVADRGFGDHKLYRVLTEELKFDYLIGFRGNIKVTAADGEARAAIDWVGQRGRTRILRGAAVTAEAPAWPPRVVMAV
jgi:hypothetical protein